MPTPTFDWAESPGAALSEEPRIASTRYGDGYELRAPDGLNPITQKWQLSFKGLDAQVGNDIRGFLRARVNAVIGLEPFNWTPLWTTTAIRVVCRGWQRTQVDGYGFSDISATFEQVFEP